MIFIDYESREKNITSIVHFHLHDIYDFSVRHIAFNLYELLRCSTNFSVSFNISISATKSLFHWVTHFKLRPAARRHAQIDFSLSFITKLCRVIGKFAQFVQNELQDRNVHVRLGEFFLNNKILDLFLTELNTTYLTWSCTNPWTSR